MIQNFRWVSLAIFAPIWARASLQLYLVTFDPNLKFCWLIVFRKASITSMITSFSWIYSENVKNVKKLAKIDHFEGWNEVKFPWKHLILGSFFTPKTVFSTDFSIFFLEIQDKFVKVSKSDACLKLFTYRNFKYRQI